VKGEYNREQKHEQKRIPNYSNDQHGKQNSKQKLEQIRDQLRHQIQTTKIRQKHGRALTPAEANYNRKNVSLLCRYCQFADPPKGEKRATARYFWCQRLCNPKRLDNLGEGKEQQVGMWTPWDFGCEVGEPIYRR